MKILVTGGAGYIGSHTCVALANAGHEPVIYDNFSNASERILSRLNTLCGKDIACITGDVCDEPFITQTLLKQKFDAVIHFAGLKSVAESQEDPIKYFTNNVGGTLNLLAAMKKSGTKSLVFSSSATVYGPPEALPYVESHPLSPVSPYGQSKLMVEKILEDLHLSDPSWSISNLRYFNPVGAHPSGMIGENPQGIPNNLMPFISQTAIGKREKLLIFGNDYETRDGTGVRDYLHVMDLAEGHVSALTQLTEPHFTTLNLGTGNGISVLELINAFEKASGKHINFEYSKRRKGDIAEFYADPTKANSMLNWTAEKTLEDMCIDTWNWQANNPEGY